MVTSQPEHRAAVAVWQYCPPVLFAFGTFGNTMTIVILRRMQMKRSAMPVFLTALAVSDMSLLYTGLLRRWIMNMFDLDIRALNYVVCKVHTWLVYATVIVSAWLLTFMTVERALSVWVPYRVSLLCTRRKACVIIAAVVLSSLGVNAHFLYGMDILSDVNGTYRECGARDEEYLYFFDAVWSWVDLTLSSLIPFTVLIIGNGLILWKVSRSARKARTLTAGCPEGVLQRKKKVSSMTVTLIALSVIFLLTTSPICVYNIVENFVEEALLDDPGGTAKLNLAWAVVNILMYTNSTVNFYLYCLSGANFRRELKKCLCCHVVRTPPGSDHGSKQQLPSTNRTLCDCGRHRHSHMPNHPFHATNRHSYTLDDHSHPANHHSCTPNHHSYTPHHPSYTPNHHSHTPNYHPVHTIHTELDRHPEHASPNGRRPDDLSLRIHTRALRHALAHDEDRHSLSTEF